MTYLDLLAIPAGFILAVAVHWALRHHQKRVFDRAWSQAEKGRYVE